jgi:predicted metal-binding membrane protein
VALVGVAWAIVILAEASGKGAALGHEGPEAMAGVHPIAGLALFLVAWQLMIAAMMLPSSLPLVRLFARASGAEERPLGAMMAFLGGYALVWSVYGAAAFFGDALVHLVVDGNDFLRAHRWTVAGGVVVLAGAFQFTELKDRCLRVCRHPGAFLLRFYQPGARGAFALGRRHGLSCLGCCWALMLVMFALGATSLWAMLVLTVLMIGEKALPAGQRIVPVTGVLFVVWGALVLIRPAWLPNVLTLAT